MGYEAGLVRNKGVLERHRDNLRAKYELLIEYARGFATGDSTEEDITKAACEYWEARRRLEAAEDV